MNITDEQKRPILIGLVAFVIGLALGLAYAWGVDPVKWVDQPISATRADLQDEYLRMAIDSFRVNADADLALKRFKDVGSNAPQVFQDIKQRPRKLDSGAISQFEQMLNQKNAFAEAAAAATPAPAKTGTSMFQVALIIGGLVAVAGVAVAAFYLFRTSRRAPEDMTPAQQAAELSRSVEKTDYAAVGAEPPVAQYVTTYVLGDDLFDDSFSIDAPSGEFLGECGVGISETIGVGEPKKVAAFEVWMFDKNDIQTITKVLMSPHAFTDPVFRAKLEPKGELVAVELRKQVVLETQTLQMIATVSDMQFGQGALPNSSYFDRVTIELAIWSKK
ncbi:MAG: hypothetical protein EHM81_01460 [Chloroflexi bacterium]|nr:MAG: hypothetical protein EHM81_01460 [Chloroflexota bacterium]